MTGSVELDRDGRTLLISFPYREDLVEVVRTLPGRRWDRASKTWRVPATAAEQVASSFMPHGFQIAPEVTGILAGTTEIAEAPKKERAPKPDTAEETEAGPLTVQQLNEQVRAALQDAFPSQVQVIGEVLNFDKNKDRKHIFFSLIEKAARGNRVDANVEVAMFERTARRVLDELQKEGLQLRDGLEILIEAKIDLYPASGRYQLIIENIKPEFTLGKLALSREQILAELRDKGLEHQNKGLSFPAPALRIGVLTSPDSDGWNDFFKELDSSGIGFEIGLYPVRVQGEQLRPTMLNGLQWFRDRTDHWDVLCILRGGGSRTDLAWLDDRDLALAVAQHPLKVVCGIGHQRDQSVLDAIAHSAKTPTAAGTLLCELHRAEVDLLAERQERLQAGTDEILRTERSALNSQASVLRRVLAGRLATEDQSLREAGQRLLRATRNRIATSARDLDRARQRAATGTQTLLDRRRSGLSHSSDQLVQLAQNRIARAQARLETQTAKQRLLDPRKILERGYCIVRNDAGQVMTGIQAMEVDEQIHLDMRDGEAQARVLAKSITKTSDGKQEED